MKKTIKYINLLKLILFVSIQNKIISSESNFISNVTDDSGIDFLLEAARTTDTYDVASINYDINCLFKIIISDKPAKEVDELLKTMDPNIKDQNNMTPIQHALVFLCLNPNINGYHRAKIHFHIKTILLKNPQLKLEDVQDYQRLIEIIPVESSKKYLLDLINIYLKNN